MIKKGRGKNFLFPAPFRTKLQGFHRLGDGFQKRVAVQARGLSLVKGHQVLGHAAALDGGQGGFFQAVRKGLQVRKAVQLAALAQRARPGENGGYRVGAGFLALEVAVVVAGDGAVRGLVLELSAGETSTLVIMARLPKAVAIMSLITSPS